MTLTSLKSMSLRCWLCYCSSLFANKLVDGTVFPDQMVVGHFIREVAKAFKRGPACCHTRVVQNECV